jgi:hypothetical protein
MKDGNEPKGANDKMKPQQQEGEEFGSVKHRQVGERNHPNRSDTPRGSEPETRGSSGRRG